jgi:hypothetical protein
MSRQIISTAKAPLPHPDFLVEVECVAEVE